MTRTDWKVVGWSVALGGGVSALLTILLLYALGLLP